MNKKPFAELVENMEQMNEIARGERAPAREFHVEPLVIKELRSKLGLSQPKCAKLLHVDVGTLRNWEQGRREPTGPARALLTAIRRTFSGRSQRGSGCRACGSVPNILVRPWPHS